MAEVQKLILGDTEYSSDQQCSLTVSGLPADDPSDGGLIRLANGWVLSADLSPEDLTQIQTLIAMNGLGSRETIEAPQNRSEEAAAEADAAFAQMVAANPNAKVIGEAPCPQPPAQSAEEHAANADEAFARMMAAYPDAKVVR